MFTRNTERYSSSVAYVLQRTARFSLVYILLIGGMVFLFTKLPTSFLPNEDQGVFLSMVQLPTGATQQRTQEVLDKVRDYYLTQEKDNVVSAFTVAGFSFAGYRPEYGSGFCPDERLERAKRQGPVG